MAEKQGITEILAEFIVATRYEDFHSEVLDLAKRCIVDGLAVMLAGSTEPCVRVVRDFVRSVGGFGECTILGRGKLRAPAQFAALVNGTAGHAMDWDDTALSATPDRGVLLHPTMPPLVAGLAIGEMLHVSGKDFLTAFLAGFEVECKLAEAISADHRIRGYHTSGTCGIFGSVAAASKLRKLSVEQVRMALGIAASMSAGLDVNLGTMTKPLHVGRACENGIVATRLASQGFDANPGALEGPKGFFHAFGGGFEQDRIGDRLGKPFSIVEPGASVKPYPCGVVGQAVMDSMRAIVARYGFAPFEVDHIKVTTGSNILPPEGPLKYGKAENALQAKFSVPFQMAAIIIRRKAGMTEFTDEFVRSPAVQDMMDRVETVVEPSFDALGRHKYVSVIEVRLKNGTLVEGKSPELIRGSSGNPLSREELMEKFHDCVQGTLNPEQARGLLATIESLESVADIQALVEKASVP